MTGAGHDLVHTRQGHTQEAAVIVIGGLGADTWTWCIARVRALPRLDTNTHSSGPIAIPEAVSFSQLQTVNFQGGL